jgi:hypothetical protein
MDPSYILMRKVRRYWLFTSSNLLEELAHDQVLGVFQRNFDNWESCFKDDHAPDVKEANSSINNRMPDSEGKKDSYLHKIKKLRGLKTASLNINSLLRHVDQLRLMLSDSEIDVFAINESKLN